VVRKGRIVFVALRSIAPGEEITYDYGREYFDYFFKQGGCQCTACLTKAAAVRRRRKTTARRPAPLSLCPHRHSVARVCHQTLGNEGASQRGPAVRVRAAEHWKPFPAKKEQHRMGARVFAATCPIGICVSSGETIASQVRFASIFATAQSRRSFSPTEVTT
jgi:hypothetical protein